MTDTPSKPKRRRWRWLVVGLLSLLALVVVRHFFTQPVVDRRFVGMWKVGAYSEFSGQYESGKLRLSSNGFGGMTPNCPLLGFWPQSFPWSVRGETLFIGGQSRNEFWWTVDNAMAWLFKRSQHYSGAHDFDVVDVTSDRIVLRRTDSTQERYRDFELKRVSTQ